MAVAFAVVAMVSSPDAGGTEEQIRARDGVETIDLKFASQPLADVLDALADATRLEVKVRGDLGMAEPQALEDVPIEGAIRRLVGDNPVNLMMIYETDAEGKRRLVKVIAQEAREVSAEERERQRMKLSLGRVEVPPPPPPPPPLNAPMN